MTNSPNDRQAMPAEKLDENSTSPDLSWHAKSRQKLHRSAKLHKEGKAQEKKDKSEPPTKKPKLKLHENNILANGRECGVVYLDTDENKYQAKIPNFRNRGPNMEKYRKDLEVLTWKPAEGPEDVDSRDLYWMVIFRQFEGHVSHDRALEHLMENQHSVAKALENIDRLLAKIGQPYAEMRGVRVLYFENLRKNQNALGSVKAIKNGQRYTMAELREFYQRFNYTDIGKKKQTACNHKDPLCQKLDFEPRWACSNCRKEDLPGKKLCLICQSYQKITGNLPSFADVFFSDDDLKKIADWKALEASKAKGISRLEFQEHFEDLEDELFDKHEDREITDDEWAYIVENYVNKHGGEKMNRENFNGKEFARFLAPHPLPLFRECDCSEEEKNQGSSVGSEGPSKEE